MTPLSELISHLDELLSSSSFADYGPNGLQVPGATEVRHVVTGVSASAALFERAAQLDADLVLVHHGLFWGEPAGPITPMLKRRLKLLFDHDMALAAYHLPLDAHPVIGNNALIAQRLGADSTEPFAEHRGQRIGVIAHFDEPRDRDALAAQIGELTQREPLVFPAGPQQVARLGIVSGGAADDIAEAIELGLDAFVTGEPAERIMSIAQESGVTFIAAGHYATETFGITALGDNLAEHFGVRHSFVQLLNPV
jgi:dinuclear metal center YbgI/SA1388 family protein